MEEQNLAYFERYRNYETPKSDFYDTQAEINFLSGELRNVAYDVISENEFPEEGKKKIEGLLRKIGDAQLSE